MTSHRADPPAEGPLPAEALPPAAPAPAAPEGSTREVDRYVDGLGLGLELGYRRGANDAERRVSEARSVGYSEGRAASAAFYRTAPAGPGGRELVIAAAVLGAVLGVIIAKRAAAAAKAAAELEGEAPDDL